MAGPRGDESSAGQALVELALSLPILVMMVLGLVTFAGAWQTYQVVTDLAREAARVCAARVQGYTEQEIVDLIVTPGLQRAGLNPGSVTTNIEDCGGAFQGDPVTVRIAYPYDLGWLGAVMAFAGGEQVITLTSAAVMQNEPVPTF
jgi:Flp pilus assembly protein TadG